MEFKRTLAVKFSEPDPFARFCLALSETEVPFTLAGFRTVIIARSDFEKLPERARRIIDDARASVDISPVTRGAKRAALPNPKETGDLLWKFSKRL